MEKLGIITKGHFGEMPILHRNLICKDGYHYPSANMFTNFMK